MDNFNDYKNGVNRIKFATINDCINVYVCGYEYS